MSAAHDVLPAQVSPPEFALSEVPPSRVVGVGIVALPVVAAGPDAGPALGPALGPGSDALVTDLGADLGVDLVEVLEQAGATGEPGEVTAVPVTGGRGPNPDLALVLLVGVGEGSPADLRRAGAALARRTLDQEAVATSLPAVADDEGLVAFVEGVVLASFGFQLRSAGPRRQPVRRVVVAGVAPDDADVLGRALALAGAGWRSRTLCTVPSNIKNPPWLAAEAERVATAGGLGIRVWDEAQLQRDGFGGLVAVGRASAQPPRLVRLDHRPRRARKAPHVVLVGKGITFDSGGLSIKPGEAMVNMKRDMTGAAVVLSVMAALRELDCPLRVTGLLCLAENAIGGDALRPGDVIRHYGGRTTEVNNTDAEGRLVLADGLAYAVDQLEPDVLVDVATLTGAVKIALGLHIGGLFSTDDALAERLLASGDAAGEPLWRLPLSDAYEDGLSSKVADAINTPAKAPAISAALFLQHFTDGLPWAHLDIASVGDALEEDHEWTAGPTGFGPRLLLRWLCGPDPMEGVRR
ncbi:MAG TPA: leucyl aminopeptidase family protein [Marmoricola sp.]|nr:leucyl aminopeptidase family protein [Marmoricola sp.]